MSVHSGMDYLLGLPLSEFIDIVHEVIEIGEERKRVQNSNKNRRRR